MHNVSFLSYYHHPHHIVINVFVLSGLLSFFVCLLSDTLCEICILSMNILALFLRLVLSLLYLSLTVNYAGNTSRTSS
jgi:hypothetical protein